MRIDILGGMGMETKEKAVQAQTGAAKGKKSRKKVWAVVIGVLLAVIVVAIAFIELSTLPRKDTADDVIYIGGMVSRTPWSTPTAAARGCCAIRW